MKNENFAKKTIRFMSLVGRSLEFYYDGNGFTEHGRMMEENLEEF